MLQNLNTWNLTMLRVINDCHLGAYRTAGTTPNSRQELTRHMRQQFEKLLPLNSDLMILGDLFDKSQVDLADLYYAFEVLTLWLKGGKCLYLVGGNHDLEKDSSKISSFQILCKLLQTLSVNIKVVDKPTMTPYGYAIPHLPNQTLFDEALAQVPECDFLFLHCNYNNFFATQSDHSLNLSKEQAEESKANQIVIAHEHNARTVGKVTLPGCQIASSVSDWINATAKYYVTINGKSIQTDECLMKVTEYIELDWKALEVTGHSFVRVIGEAKVSEAALVVNTIAKFRTKSPALVVSNAVKMESNEALDGFDEALETVQGFDVWNALEATLAPDEMTILRGLE
jgi:hypothetical protein